MAAGRSRRAEPIRVALPAVPSEYIARVAQAAPPEMIAPPPSDRHREVLAEALALFGERGYAGASLRELARRLGMAQPSLYHYVDSKERLVEQIITHFGAELLGTTMPGPPPSRLRDVPRFIVDLIFAVYANPAYPKFLRFAFAVSTERPQYREALRLLYGQGFELGTRVLTRPFVESGEISEADARAIMRTAVNAIGLYLMEEVVMYGHPPTTELRAYAEQLVRLLEDLIKLRAGSRKA